MYGISVDTPDISKRQVVQQLGVQFPLLSDQSRETIKAYGVHNRIADISKPATFIIDKEGIIQWKEVGADKSDRVFSDQILQQLMAIKDRENTPPTISPALSAFSTEEGQTLTVELSNYAADEQDAPQDLRWRLTHASNPIFHAWVREGQLTIQPFEGARGTAEITLSLVDSQGTEVSQRVQVTVTPKPLPTFDLIVPEGLSLIHLPLAVTQINGAPRAINRLSDLFEVIGGTANVHWLITTRLPEGDESCQFQTFLGSVPDSVNTPANIEIQPQTGIIASVRQPVKLNLMGQPLRGELHLYPGPNLIGLPRSEARLWSLSELIQLEGIRDNVTLIALHTDGGFRVFSPAQIIPDSSNDLEIAAGQAFVMIAQTRAVVSFR